MSTRDVVRAWKDPHYRAALPPAQRARLPESPSGVVEVPVSDLAVNGGLDDALNGTVDRVCASYTCYYTCYYTCGPCTIEGC